MVSYGDEVYINDLGLDKKLMDVDTEEATKTGLYAIYLVEESDGSINWYINPNYREDTILVTRYISLTVTEKKEFGIE